VPKAIPKIRIRAAVQTDKAPLFSFVSRTWSWGDYVPDVWDEWFADRGGRIFVAEAGSKQVAMNHVRLLDDNVCWMEGVRVHPDFRRRGIATKLGQHSIDYGRQKGAKIFRLLSGFHNAIAHAQVARLGFKEKARFEVYRRAAATAPKESAAVKTVGIEEAGKAFRAIKNSGEYKTSRGFCLDEFVAYQLDKRLFRKYLSRGLVHYCGTGKEIAYGIYNLHGVKPRGWGQIIFLCGNNKAAGRIAEKALRDFYGNRMACYAFLPERTSISNTLARLRFTKEEGFILFETRRD
jgi:GNAT superfamily N-acetyltransferase